MAYFPRVGVEFSAAANVRFLAGPVTHKRPAHIVRFENGWQSARFSTSAPTRDFVVVFTGPVADLAIITDFFDTYGVVSTFTVDHPYFGEVVSRLKQTEHSIEPVAGGDPTWWRVEIPMEGIF